LLSIEIMAEPVHDIVDNYMTLDNMPAEKLAIYGTVMDGSTSLIPTGNEKGGNAAYSSDSYLDEVWTVNPGMPGSYQYSPRAQMQQNNIQKHANEGRVLNTDSALFGDDRSMPSQQAHATSLRAQMQRSSEPPKIKRPSTPQIAVLWETQSGEQISAVYTDIVEAEDSLVLVAADDLATRFFPKNCSAEYAAQISWANGTVLYSVVPLGIVFTYQTKQFCALRVTRRVTSDGAGQVENADSDED